MSGDARVQSSWAQWNSGGGVSGPTMLAAPCGLRAAADIKTGDALRTAFGGPVRVIAQREARGDRWMRIPPLALGNRREIFVAAGQGLLIESALAAPITGSMAVVVPALALCHWRGIAPSAARLLGVSFTLSRPALIVAGSGVLIAMDGPANSPLGTVDLPPVPSLSLLSARQLIACLIAYEAGASLRGISPQAAAF